MGPMGIPFRSRSALIFPYSSAALAEKSNTAIGDRNREDVYKRQGYGDALK